MKDLNAEQIKKALECCFGNSTCAECPYNDWVGCHRQMMKNAIAIIKELTEENENLHASCTELIQKCASLEADVAKEFTCVFGTPHKVSDCPINDEIAKAKTDTVRKMQDRFNEVFGGMDATQALLRRTFDHIVKEMLEEMQ